MPFYLNISPWGSHIKVLAFLILAQDGNVLSFTPRESLLSGEANRYQFVKAVGWAGLLAVVTDLCTC